MNDKKSVKLNQKRDSGGWGTQYMRNAAAGRGILIRTNTLDPSIGQQKKRGTGRVRGGGGTSDNVGGNRACCEINLCLQEWGWEGRLGPAKRTSAIRIRGKGFHRPSGLTHGA